VTTNNALLARFFLRSTSTMNTPTTSPTYQTDPWELQARIMRISGQSTPLQPALTLTALLYFALIMEELGETGLGMVRLLNAQRFSQAPEDQCIASHILDGPYADRGYVGAAAHLNTTSRELVRYASLMRQMHAEATRHLEPGLEAHVNRQDREQVEAAVEILDGLTDLVVVVTGMAAALGLPGPDAYEEVAASNLSKANPDTGVIDKDPSGKWIKGRDYKAPNLAAVLQKAAWDGRSIAHQRV
jgi:hypothetical protein